jgi:hypothetical protein
LAKSAAIGRPFMEVVLQFFIVWVAGFKTPGDLKHVKRDEPLEK